MKKSAIFLAILCSFLSKSYAAETKGAGGMSVEAAKAEALKMVPGTLIEVEEETHKGIPAISVEIKANDGIHEIVFSKADGKVLSQGLEDDDDKHEKGENGKK